jgi:electron transport complex protein RnfG
MGAGLGAKLPYAVRNAESLLGQEGGALRREERPLAALRIAAVLLALAVPASGHEAAHKAEPGVLRTQTQALREAFGGAPIERKTAYLTKGQVDRVSALAGSRLESAVVSCYLARSSDGIVGAAFFESHPLRDGSETIMAKVSPNGRLADAVLLAFREPGDYLPPQSWREGLRGLGLADLKRPMRPPSTNPRTALCADAYVDGVKRLLAVFEVLRDDAGSGLSQNEK